MRPLLAVAIVLASFAFGAVSWATPPGANGSIVFVRVVGSDAQLFRVEPDGSGLKQITNADWYVDVPDWSPDGRSIVATLETTVWGSHVMDAEGRNPRLVLQMTPPGQELESDPVLTSDDASFSPDGKSIVFLRWEDEGFLGTWVVGVDGSGLRRVVRPGRETTDFDPNFSPDGRWITFVRQDDRRERLAGEHVRALFIVRADGSGLRQLTPYSWHAAVKHDWSPDGKRILLTVGADTGRRLVSANLVTIRPNGTDRRPVTRFLGGVRHAFAGSYSPDGKQIAFRFDSGRKESPSGRSFSVAVIDTDGRNLRPLTTSRALVRSIDWGPTPT